MDDSSTTGDHLQGEYGPTILPPYPYGEPHSDHVEALASPIQPADPHDAIPSRTMSPAGLRSIDKTQEILNSEEFERLWEESVARTEAMGYNAGANGGHAAGCHESEEGTPEEEPYPWASEGASLEPDDVQDTVQPPKKKRKRNNDKTILPAEQRAQMSLHSKARELKSMPDLPEYRYSIGVVVPDVRLGTIRKESDLIWMKGHGGSTVNTILRMFQQHTLIAKDLTLLINGEFPAPITTMRELDHFNDRHVVFRAVEQCAIIDD